MEPESASTSCQQNQSWSWCCQEQETCPAPRCPADWYLSEIVRCFCSRCFNYEWTPTSSRIKPHQTPSLRTRQAQRQLADKLVGNIQPQLQKGTQPLKIVILSLSNKYFLLSLLRRRALLLSVSVKEQVFKSLSSPDRFIFSKCCLDQVWLKSCALWTQILFWWNLSH